MSSIGPGDFLECIEADTDGRTTLTVGAVYRCSGVFPDLRGYNDCTLHGKGCRKRGAFGLTLHEVPTPPGWNWCSETFKPIYRPNKQFIKDLQVPVKSGVDA